MKSMQKVSRGSGFRGCVAYSLEEGKAKLIGGNMSGETARELGAEFGSVRRLRPDIKKPVWHQSLRLPASEKICEQLWPVVADDYMRQLGFTPGHQRAYFLEDLKNGQHIHIVANRIALDGRIYYGQNENLKSTKIVANLEKKYGLQITKTAAYDETGHVVMPEKAQCTADEVNMAIREGEQPPKIRLQTAIDAAIADGPEIRTFCDRLQIEGISICPNINTSSFNGFGFCIDGVKFKGSDLGQSYKWSNLQKQVAYDKERDFAFLTGLKNASTLVVGAGQHTNPRDLALLHITSPTPKTGDIAL